MRVNIYAEEMTDRLEIIGKEIDGHNFTGLRFYLELPVTMPNGDQASGPFMHRPGDDDSSAVTFWGKRDLRAVLHKALRALDEHYQVRDSVPTYQTLTEKAVGVLQRYIEPGGLSKQDALSELLDIFDGPEYRQVVGGL